MHGPLQEIGLVEVLQLLARGERTGTLRVTGPDPTAPRTMHLSHGRIVSVGPAATDSVVHKVLVSRHLAAVETPPSELLGPIGEAVREELAMRSIATMLHWTRGRFDFSESPDESGPLDIPIDTVLVELVGSESQRVELAEQLDAFHAVPVFAPTEALEAGPPVVLEPLDWRILDGVDGTRDVGAIAAQLDEPLERVGERVRALQSAAILELRAAPRSNALAARAAIEAGRYDDAVLLLASRVEVMSGDREAWRLLGLAEVGAGRFDRAIRAWESWQAGDPALADEATTLITAARTMLEALRDHRD